MTLALGSGSGHRVEAQAAGYDLVVANGRVMDPASGLDAVRNVGIRGGRIAIVTERPLTGRRVIDAKGLVVAPGFIDLHSHSIPFGGDRWQVRDGVTTALELEEGAFPVAEWYARLEGRSYVNFGASAGHIPARVAVMQHATTLDEAYDLRRSADDPTPPWSHRPAGPDDLNRLTAVLEAGLAAGGLGIGFEINESPAASREEILTLFRVARRHGVPIYAHLRQMGTDPITGSLAGVDEVLADLVATGAATHFVHLGSSALIYAPTAITMIEAARRGGLDVTAEVYPYTAASTGINTALFEGDWQARLGIGYGDLEWPPTGERLDSASFIRYRSQGGPVIIHMIPDSIVTMLVARPGVMIASDAMPLIEGRGHPRGVGTFARVLGRFVREQRALPLMEALRKMTVLPAERVRGAAPRMARKGRLAVGADADVTVFDPGRIIDRATFADPEQASVGVAYVVVNGVVAVDGGALVPGIAPGQAIKRGDR